LIDEKNKKIEGERWRRENKRWVLHRMKESVRGNKRKEVRRKEFWGYIELILDKIWTSNKIIDEIFCP